MTVRGDSTVARRRPKDIRVLGLAALLGLSTVVAVGGLHLQRVRSHLEQTREGAARRHVLIAEVQEQDARLLLLFFGWVTMPDLRSDAANAAAVATSELAVRSSAAWEEFTADPPVSGQEDDLRTRFEELTVGGLEAAEALYRELSEPTDDPAELKERMTTVAELEAAALERGEVLSQLRALHADAEEASSTATEMEASHAVRDVAGASVAVLVVLLGLFAVADARSRRRADALAAVEQELAAESSRNELEARLHRAFEMVRTEAGAFALVEEAVRSGAPGATSELLVADSSRAHLRRVACTDGPDASGCDVGSPADCPAARNGQTQVFPSALAIDACPHLRSRPGASSSICVPVSIAGNTVGVLHAVPQGDDPIDAAGAATLEMVARRAGERVGMLRAFARSESQARTDPLTGLLNRRSLEERAREVVAADRGYAVAFGDLDHFKHVNDIHGHDVGDRALRLFSRVVRDSVEQGQVAARYGGEEFVVVVPDDDGTEALVLVERIRTALARATDAGLVPRFTVSFGIAASAAGDSFADVVESADAALLKAKADGRDRVVLAGLVESLA